MSAILFDLDGTLADSLPGITFSIDCAITECGFPPRTCDPGPLLGPPIRSILHTLCPAAQPAELDTLERSFRTSYDAGGWRKTSLFQHVRDALDTLAAAGNRLFLATNKPAVPTARIVAELGLTGRFIDVLSRNSVDPPFPSKAAMLRFAMERHAITPGEAVYIGDSHEDYRAATEAGIPVIIVDHGYADWVASLPARPYALLRDFSELPPVISKLFPS
jgi:phosphoglycolate phosphatase